MIWIPLYFTALAALAFIMAKWLEASRRSTEAWREAGEQAKAEWQRKWDSH